MARPRERHGVAKRRSGSNRIEPRIGIELRDREVAQLDRRAESQEAQLVLAEPRVEAGHPQGVLSVREFGPHVRILRVDTRGDVQGGDGVVCPFFEQGAEERSHFRRAVAPREAW